MLSSFFRSGSVLSPDPGPDALRLQYYSFLKSPFFCQNKIYELFLRNRINVPYYKMLFFFKNSNFCFWRLRFFQIDGIFLREFSKYRKFVRIKQKNGQYQNQNLNFSRVILFLQFPENYRVVLCYS